MLTVEQYEALQDVFDRVSTPINEYLIKDIVDRIITAGKITSTAKYKAEIAKMLDIHMADVEKYIKKYAAAKNADFALLFRQVAELIYKQNTANAVKTVPFAENKPLQRIISAAVALAQDDFTNITQTLGMIDPYGNAMPLRDAYVSCCDYAFEKVLTGADTYQNAVNEAVVNLANKGVVTVDYQSGIHSNIDVAVRRSVFGGMGLMVEQIEQQMHDEMGADGWEISAHEACAVDHEPIQGRQYSNEDYEALNDSLQRRIGTLNCKHVAFPIILGVSKPQYSEEELQAMAERNAKGITFEGKHYTQYEATQTQRAIERKIRLQNRRITAYKQDPMFDKKLKETEIKRNRLEEYYKTFSDAAGLRTQIQRLNVAQINITNPQNAYIPVVKEQDYVSVKGNKYVVDGKNVIQQHSEHERDIANVLSTWKQEPVYLLPRVNYPKGIATADFSINDTYYELKTIYGSGENALFNPISKHWKQADRFVCDVSNTILTNEDVYKQAKALFSRRRTLFIKEIIITRDGKVINQLKK